MAKYCGIVSTDHLLFNAQSCLPYGKKWNIDYYDDSIFIRVLESRKVPDAQYHGIIHILQLSKSLSEIRCLSRRSRRPDTGNVFPINIDFHSAQIFIRDDNKISHIELRHQYNTIFKPKNRLEVINDLSIEENKNSMF